MYNLQQRQLLRILILNKVLSYKVENKRSIESYINTKELEIMTQNVPLIGASN